jgi:hypothetical protein
MTAVVCLLIVSFVSRSFVVRASERLQKIHSLIDSSSQPEVDCNEEDGSPSKPIICLGKRVRDEYELSKHLERSISIDSLSLPRWFGQFQKLPFLNSQLKLVSNSINSIEKPPKV